MTTARDPWILRIEPLPCEVPAVNRVRSALKLLLRRFRLKCTAILESSDNAQPAKHEESAQQ